MILVIYPWENHNDSVNYIVFDLHDDFLRCVGDIRDYFPEGHNTSDPLWDIEYEPEVYSVTYLERNGVPFNIKEFIEETNIFEVTNSITIYTENGSWLITSPQETARALCDWGNPPLVYSSPCIMYISSHANDGNTYVYNDAHFYLSDYCEMNFECTPICIVSGTYRRRSGDFLTEGSFDNWEIKVEDDGNNGEYYNIYRKIKVTLKDNDTITGYFGVFKHLDFAPYDINYSSKIFKSVDFRDRNEIDEYGLEGMGLVPLILFKSTSESDKTQVALYNDTYRSNIYYNINDAIELLDLDNTDTKDIYVINGSISENDKDWFYLLIKQLFNPGETTEL